MHDDYVAAQPGSIIVNLHFGKEICKAELRGINYNWQMIGSWEGGQMFILCSDPAVKYAKRNLTMIMEDVKDMTAYFVDVTTVILFLSVTT